MTGTERECQSNRKGYVFILTLSEVIKQQKGQRKHDWILNKRLDLIEISTSISQATVFVSTEDQ